MWINDNAGHLVGDEVLKLIAATIETRIRATDSLYRYGGDEFIVLASSADVNTAAKLAEDIRRLIVEVVKIESLPVTVSVGVAEFSDDDSPEVWLTKADAAMYTAKRAGRNTVSFEPATG